MVKYSKKDIISYINGDDIDNINELEMDKSFMLDVINTSKDINMIKLCDDSLLEDIDFIKSLIDIFSNSKTTCWEIIKKYSKLKDETSNLCLAALMVNKFNRGTDIYDEDTMGAKVDLNCNFSYDSMVFRRTCGSNDFDLYEKRYSRYPELLFYSAKRLTDDILSEITTEQIDVLLHSNFESKEEYLKYGSDKIIFFILLSKDRKLAKYYLNHKEIANDFEKTLKYKLSKWDDVESDIILTIEDMVYGYVLDEGFYLTSKECFLHLAKKFKMPSLVQVALDYDSDDEFIGFNIKVEDESNESPAMAKIKQEQLDELDRRVNAYLQTLDVDAHTYKDFK